MDVARPEKVKSKRPTARAIGAIVIAVLLLSLAAFILLPSFGRRLRESVADQPIRVPPPPEVDPGAIKELLPRGSIQAIDDPHFEPAGSADAFTPACRRNRGSLVRMASIWHGYSSGSSYPRRATRGQSPRRFGG